MERTAVYYRVSTDRQDFASQREVVEEWLRQLPEIRRPRSLIEFTDEGVSGKTAHRPEFQRMLAHAYERRVDTIVVYRLDRFSRNASDAIRTI